MTTRDPSFLHLTATNNGGAGIAAMRIHRALTDNGFRSRMVVSHGVDRPGVTVLRGVGATAARTASKAMFRAATRPRYYFRDQRHDAPGASRAIDSTLDVRPNAVIAHALTDFLSFGTLARLARRHDARVLWSLMDMASFTGGCHYSWECLRYHDACGECPALRVGSGPNDWSARTLREKRAALAGMRSTVVAASTWLAEQARVSALFRDTAIEIVPLSVSPETFAPRDRDALRSELGLDRVRPVIFFGARDHRDARKGMDVLMQALIRLSSQLAPETLPTLLIAGDGSPFEPLAARGFAVRQLGLLAPDDLARAYAAADLYVSPSIEDSGPLMVNEAVMSGTPVVAFEVGVAIDLIEPNVTGMFARCGDADALATAMAGVLGWDDARVARARARARAIGLERCSPAAQAKAFARLAMADVGEGR